ncbi:MAG TPA: methionyl-tRNA formyltransferase [Pirellulales bacterium]|jgi:methionyl-tRNA formyltransferase|nr:methionyl-tRNA formyltransferase [Pirellulales bacterium]
MLRLIMMGTGPFAVPTFRRLLGSGHRVELLVTRPPRALHGKQQADVNPMREVAREAAVPIFEPESVNTDEAREKLVASRPDLLVVCDYGQILKSETIATARLGGINLHASLLPKYRGAAPVQWAVFHGETETGVSVFQLTAGVDAGPLLAIARVVIGSEETAVALELRLSDVGAGLMVDTVDALDAGTATPLAQDAAQASRAPRLKKTDGQIDWSRSAAAIKNQIRAFAGWPKSYTDWLKPGGPTLRLILDAATVENVAEGADQPAGSPSQVLVAEGDRLVVATGAGALRIERLQPAGKRVLSAGEFLRGYPVRAGQSFGPTAG